MGKLGEEIEYVSAVYYTAYTISYWPTDDPIPVVEEQRNIAHLELAALVWCHSPHEFSSSCIPQACVNLNSLPSQIT